MSYTYSEVTSTMKYVKTFSFQVHPSQPTLMELFTFATKALQLLGTKLANKEHPQFHFHKLFCFKQHFSRSPNINTMHYGIRADILKKKAIRKCSTLKIDFSANFHLTHDFFWRGLSQHPKNWKTQKGIYKYQFKGV